MLKDFFHSVLAGLVIGFIIGVILLLMGLM